MKKIKLLIADDHAIMRMGLTAILSTKKDIQIVGEAEDGDDAIRRTRELRPDVVLMDVMMPKTDGATATETIHRLFPEVRILILTTFGSADAIAHALRSGASGAVLKNIAYQDLVETIRAIAAGKRVIAPEIQRMLKDSPPVETLSERQLAVLDAMIRGLTDADIATALGLTPNGVRDHITQIYAKLGAANRAEAVAIALRKHLLKTMPVSS